jgi:hypothetical protein
MEKLCECGCGELTPISPRTYNKQGIKKGQPRRFILGHSTRVCHGTPKERLKRRVREDERGCWVWQGPARNDGYGTMRFRGKQWGAHRVAYTLFVGEIPGGLIVCHTCDLPRCVNPDHLWLGTPADNTRDAITKNRLVGRRGEQNPACRYPDEVVAVVRKRYAEGGITIKELARTVGMSEAHTSAVVRGKTRRLPTATG